MTITIAYFERDIAVCYDGAGRVLNIHLGELPEEAREGDTLRYADGEGYVIAGAESADHNARIADKRLRHFYDEN